MKKTELVFSSILVPIDYITLILAALSAYFLRYSEFYAAYIREVVFDLSLGGYFKLSLPAAVGWIVIFALSGIYSIKLHKKIFDELRRIFLACSTCTLLLIAVFFFSRELFSSRFIILAVWAIAIIYISIIHIIIRLIQRILYTSGAGIARVILVGNGPNNQTIKKELDTKLFLGYKVMAEFDQVDNLLLDKIQELKRINEIDEIIQTNPDLNKEQVLRLIDWCQEYHLTFKYTTDLLGAQAGNIQVDTLAGIPVVEIKKTPLDGWGRIIKRIVDILSSFFGLIILSPLFVITAIIIKIDSKGPVFYQHPRVGAKDEIFSLYKFRSMSKDADAKFKELLNQNERADGPLFKLKNDPRVTRIGKFLRKSSLDELPQLINVLQGQMSLVGPRPHLPHEVEKYQKHHKKLLNIKPGITGMAQVSGRSDLPFEDEVKLDVFYIENWTLRLDLIILVKTPFVLLFSRTAY